MLVHERLTELGGSEAVVQNLARVCPDSTLFVPIAKPDLRIPVLDELPRRTSPLQSLYRGGSYSYMLPLLPVAMRFALCGGGDFDAIIVSHHAFANRVRVPAHVPIISYVHTPARWLWQPEMRVGEGGRVGEAALSAFSALYRRGDRSAAGRVSYMLANSNSVAERIATWWGRSADVIHPPVDIEKFSPGTLERENFFLVAGRLVPYKRPEIAVAAAREAGVSLVVVGEGRQYRECLKVAGPQTKFLGRVSDGDLLDLYRRCSAVIFPGNEDFGIVPVEAQACGTPVIALGIGGALDTVRTGETGILVQPTGSEQGDVDAFSRAIRQFDKATWDRGLIRKNSENFSASVFQLKMARAISGVLGGSA